MVSTSIIGVPVARRLTLPGHAVKAITRSPQAGSELGFQLQRREAASHLFYRCIAVEPLPDTELDTSVHGELDADVGLGISTALPLGADVAPAHAVRVVTQNGREGEVFAGRYRCLGLVFGNSKPYLVMVAQFVATPGVIAAARCSPPRTLISGDRVSIQVCDALASPSVNDRIA